MSHELGLVPNILIQTRPDLLEMTKKAGSERPQLYVLGYLSCEQAHGAFQIMEHVTVSIDVRVQAWCVDGIILHCEDAPDIRRQTSASVMKSNNLSVKFHIHPWKQCLSRWTFHILQKSPVLMNALIPEPKRRVYMVVMY